jgi:putative effector of murein hydrolase LrgA (UPF0299 family)
MISLPPNSLLGLVVLLSLLLTGYELYKMFERDFGRAITNRYALLLAVLNIITAIVVWFFIHKVIGVESTLVTALVTGLTFPMLLRSRFTLYRSLNTSSGPDQLNEISLKIDEMYQKLQYDMYKEVNLHLTEIRLTLSKRIRDAFTIPQMTTYLDEFIDTERIEAERDKHRNRFNEIIAIADEAKRHRQLANMLIDLKSSADLDKAIRTNSLHT